MSKPSLSDLLKKKQHPLKEIDFDRDLENLQKRLLRIQQGIYHGHQRVIIAVEGFDAAGKGGMIRRLTEKLDPRGVQVHGIGAPSSKDQAKHYLYRFWKLLPEPGTIAIFDRTWYGRVLVERVEKLTEKKRWHQAYDEINSFEQTLRNDGIDIIKIFLGLSKEEQLQRYQDRLGDPYKQWKLGEEDLRNRQHWRRNVEAVDDMFGKTSTKNCPWKLVPADHKPSARHLALSYVADRLKHHEKWMNSAAAQWTHRELKKELKKMS